LLDWTLMQKNMDRSNKCEINNNNLNVTKQGILIIWSTQNLYLLQSLFKK
jgi:hypothetical protein